MSVAATLSRFRLLQIRRLRRHRLRTVLSVLGVATGVALVIAVATVYTSVSKTAETVAELGAGSSYELTRPGGFDPDTIAEIAAVPGVVEASTAVHVPVLIDGEAGWLIGIEPTAGLDGLGRHVAAVTGPQSGSHLPDSGPVQVTGLDGTTTEVIIDSRAPAPLRDRFGGRFVAAPVEVAVEVAGVGRPSSVFVFGDPARDDLTVAAGPGASAQSAADKVSFAESALAPILSSLLLIALMGVVVGVALVFNTVNTNALENRNEVAALRALGSDRRSARLGAILEGLVIGVTGSVVGLLLGLIVGTAAVDTVPDAFANLIGSAIEPTIPWWLPMLGLASGIGLSLVSIIGPVRSAGRVEPIEGIRQTEAAEFEHARTSLLHIGIGVAALVVSVVVRGGLGILLAALGSVWLLRSGLPWLTKAVAAVAGRFGPSGRLASLALARSPRRVWSTTLVVVLAAGISLMTVGALNDFSRTGKADLSTAGRPTFWVSTVSGDNVPVVGLPTEWTAEITALDGVTEVAATRLVSTGYEGHQIGVFGVHGDSAYSFYALASPDARAAVQAGTAIIVNRQFADVFDVAVGDDIALPGAVPQQSVTVAAITEGVAVAEGGLVVVSASTLQSVFGVDSFASYEVTADPDTTAQVEQDLTALTDRAAFPVRIIASSEFLDDALVSVTQIQTLMALILVVIALCAGIAAFNTFAAAILVRTREFAMLRAIGTTRNRIGRSVIVEALSIGLVAGLLGALLGSYLHYLASGALESFFHIEYHFSPAIAVISVLVSVGIVLVGSLLPVRRGTSGDIIESLAFE